MNHDVIEATIHPDTLPDVDTESTWWHEYQANDAILADEKRSDDNANTRR